MNRLGPRMTADDLHQGRQPEPLSPVFEQGQIENHGIWIEMVPHLLKMIIVDSGNGGTPMAGDFIRLKQFTYLEDMTLVKAERLTYLFGRGHLLPGLEVCLAMCREGFKARCFLASCYAYGNEKVGKIQKNSCLVIDIEVTGITKEPLTRERMQDELLVAEIIKLAREGENLVKRGASVEGQRKLESAFQRIQSTRSKEIKNHLYMNYKSPYYNTGEDSTSDMQKDKRYLTDLYQRFDAIKVRGVEVALLNQDYYKVIILTKQCLMESRLQLNESILMARSKAFGAIGQFQEAIKLARHLSDKHPENEYLRSQLLKTQKRQEKYLQIIGDEIQQPILNLFQVKVSPKEKPKQRTSKDKQNPPSNLEDRSIET